MAHICLVATLSTCMVLGTSVAAPIALSRTFGDHMVLQRDATSPAATVWGTGDAGVSVTMTFNGKQYGPAAVTDGIWRIPLPSTPAGGPYTLLFNATDGSSTSLADVLMGDVFLCGGQSNMQFTLSGVINASAEVAAAANYPDIRLFTVGQGTASQSPLLDLATVEQNWTVASPASVGLGNWTAFSAVCWLFGRDVYDALGGSVPIGLISNNWGGTPIQAWSSPDALAECGPAIPGPPNPSPNPPADWQNSTLWNAMVNPYTVGPMAVTGAIWYQGESNAPPFTTNASWYACAFPAMITDWRAKLDNLTMWFGFVLLAPFTAGVGTGYAAIREAQLAALSLPRVGMGSAVDVGDVDSPWGTYHPRFKQPVGARLAAAAAVQLYGQDSAPYRGPVATAATGSAAPSNGAFSVVVSFDPDTLSGGLRLQGGDAVACPAPAGNVLPDECAGFQILVGYQPGYSPPPLSYINSSGTALAGGLPLYIVQGTLQDGLDRCSATPACAGVTYNASAPVTPGVYDIVLKDLADPTPVAGWASYYLPHPGAAYRDFTFLQAQAVVNADGQSLTLTAQATQQGQVAAYVAYAYGSWPVAPLYNDAGLPAVPWMLPVQ